MVESNNDEERLARIEQMLEAIQHETTGLKTNTNTASRPRVMSASDHGSVPTDEFGHRPRRDDDPSN
jgi:hypothetical protein